MFMTKCTHATAPAGLHPMLFTGEQRRALVEVEVLHAEWMAAEQAANAAEAGVRQAAQAHAEGAGPGATWEHFEAALRLRTAADAVRERVLAVVRREPI